MGTIPHSIWIGAPPSLVWDVYTNLDRISEWQTGDPRLLDVSGRGDEVVLPTPFAGGPGAARTTVTKTVRPAVHASRTEAYLGLSFDLIANLLAEQDGTRLLLRAQTHWPKSLGVFGRVVEYAFLNGREARRELERLKVLVEGEAAKESQHQ